MGLKDNVEWRILWILTVKIDIIVSICDKYCKHYNTLIVVDFSLRRHRIFTSRRIAYKLSMCYSSSVCQSTSVCHTCDLRQTAEHVAKLFHHLIAHHYLIN